MSYVSSSVMDRLVFYIAVILLVHITCGHSLNANDPHVCMKNSASGKPKYKCCSYAIYNAKTRSCELKCKRGCIGGICVSIDRCHCSPPLVLRNNNECVMPTPKCDPPCENGRCTADNTCTCNSGYISASDNTCVPDCQPPCINGLCVAPNLCACNEGYTLNNSSECTPVCHTCSHGDCIAPLTCQCHEGYERVNGNCEPVCRSDCVNGNCTEPDKCTCFDGYEADTQNPYACKPVCETPCVNGLCTAPDTCTCVPGYTFTITAPDTDGECEPICRPACVNGFCAGPNKCDCFEGFARDALHPHICHPTCSTPCVNASCVAPDTCSCNYGYKSVNETDCAPTCHHCEHGDCVAPNVCRCHEGYTLEMRKNSTTLSCFKTCSCDNGECVDGECVCNRGYELDNDTCVELKPMECSGCQSKCQEQACWCDDGRPCYQAAETGPEESAAVGLAGLEISWLLGGCVGLLLVTVIIVVISRIWRKRAHVTETANGTTKSNVNESVVFIAPDTLMQRRPSVDAEDDFDKDPLSRKAFLEERL